MYLDVCLSEAETCVCSGSAIHNLQTHLRQITLVSLQLQWPYPSLPAGIPPRPGTTSNHISIPWYFDVHHWLAITTTWWSAKLPRTCVINNLINTVPIATSYSCGLWRYNTFVYVTRCSQIFRQDIYIKLVTRIAHSITLILIIVQIRLFNLTSLSILNLCVVAFTLERSV